MTCEEARQAFTDLHDGTLSGPPLGILSQHLDACAACRAEWAIFRRTMRALADLGEEEPSPGFAARVAEQVEAPSFWQRIVGALVYPLRVKVPIHAAALVLLGVAGLWLFQRSPELRRATDLQAPTGSERSAAAPSPAAPVSPPQPARQLETQPSPPSEPTAALELETKPSAPSASPKTVAPPAPAPAGAPPGAGRIESPATGREREGVDQLPSARDEAAKRAAPPPGDGARTGETPMTASRALRAAPVPQELRGQTTLTPGTEPEGAAKAKEGFARRQGTADDVFSEAAADFAAHRYDSAIEALRVFLAQYPRDGRAPDARFLLADAYRVQKRYAESSAEFDAFLRQYPTHRMAAAALYRQAEVRLAMGDQAGCAMLRDALSRYPEDHEAGSGRETLSARCP